MYDYDVTQYTCHDGGFAKILIPNNVTEDDLRGLYELLQVVAVRRFGLDLTDDEGYERGKADRPQAEAEKSKLNLIVKEEAVNVLYDNFASISSRTDMQDVLDKCARITEAKQSELTEAYIRGYKDGAEQTRPEGE